MKQKTGQEFQEERDKRKRVKEEENGMTEGTKKEQLKCQNCPKKGHFFQPGVNRSSSVSFLTPSSPRPPPLESLPPGTLGPGSRTFCRGAEFTF